MSLHSFEAPLDTIGTMMKNLRSSTLLTRLSQEDGQVAAVGLLYGFVTVLALGVGAFIMQQLPEGSALLGSLLTPEVPSEENLPNELQDSLATLKEIKL